MSIIESIIKCIKNIPSDYDNLFRYTERIQSNNQWENLLLNNTDKIFYINYPNLLTYIAIGQCKEYIISSDSDLNGLKNLQYEIKSYGENIDTPLKIFGGVSFNLNQESTRSHV